VLHHGRGLLPGRAPDPFQQLFGENTRPGAAASISSSAYSLGRSISWTPSTDARRAAESMRSAPTCSTLGISGGCERRSTAWIRATSSRCENGLTR